MLLFTGTTLHSVAQISGNVNKRKLEGTWSLINTLIVDEVSMIGCCLLAKLANRLTTAKQPCPAHIPFGGIDILFAGNFQDIQLLFKSMINLKHYILK